MPELPRRRYPERSDELFERATLCGFGEGRARHTLQTARRATLRPHHTPGQPTAAGLRGAGLTESFIAELRGGNPPTPAGAELFA
jgi:hypothetical protein